MVQTYNNGFIPHAGDIVIQIRRSSISRFTMPFKTELKVKANYYQEQDEEKGLEFEGYPDSIGADPGRFNLIRRNLQDSLDKILEE